MTVGSLLDRAFRMYGGNFALMLGIVAVSYVPIYAVSLALNAWAMTVGGENAIYIKAGAQLVILLLGGLIAYPLSEGAAIVAVSERYLGRPASIGQAYRQALRRWGTILNAQISVGLRVLLGLILLIVPGVIWALNYSVTVPAVMLEGLKATDAMRRSKELTLGERSKVLSIMFVIGALFFVVGIAMAVAVSMVIALDTPGGELVLEVTSDLAQLFTSPLGVIAPILLYYDFRIRKEGFDLEMLSQAMAHGSAAGTSATPAAPGI